MDVAMLDPIDVEIISLLQENARLPQAEIARTVGLAPSAVLERLRKLEAKGVITGYAAQIDPRALDQRLLAFIAVRTTDRPGERRVANELAAVPEVLEVHHVAGEDCLMLKVRARDPQHLSQILRDRLGAIAGVQHTRTTIVLETIKESARLPISMAAKVEEVTS
jgi:Lrp/AsnC family transcriptional regulator, leucine-responsive regulatory protein